MDAFVLLMRFDTSKLNAMKNRQFELKAGALLVDVKNGRNDLMATHHNLTDELALYHLRTNPKSIKHFAKYPKNWEELANKSSEEATEPKENDKPEKVANPVEENENVTDTPEEATEPKEKKARSSKK